MFRPLYPQRKDPWYPLDTMLCLNGSRCVEDEKILAPAWDKIPVFQSVTSDFAAGLLVYLITHFLIGLFE
jgi:hypothetical protein